MEIKDLTSNNEFIGFKFELHECVFCTGTYQIQEDTICILIIRSERKGGMKFIVSQLVRIFGTNKIIFYNLMNQQLQDKLHGFETKERFDEYFKCNVKYLEGVWK